MRLGAFSRPTQHLPAPSPQETLAWMAKFIRDGQQDQRVRELAERLVAGIFSHDYLSEYAAVLNWVRANIKYRRDPRTIEQVKTPQIVLQTQNGDCDDMAVLIGTLVGSLGAQVRLVAGAMRGAPIVPRTGKPMLSHVWVEAFDPKSDCWVVLDPVPGRKVNEMLGRLAHVVVLPVL